MVLVVGGLCRSPGYQDGRVVFCRSVRRHVYIRTRGAAPFHERFISHISWSKKFLLDYYSPALSATGWLHMSHRKAAKP